MESVSPFERSSQLTIGSSGLIARVSCQTTCTNGSTHKRCIAQMNARTMWASGICIGYTTFIFATLIFFSNKFSQPSRQKNDNIQTYLTTECYKQNVNGGVEVVESLEENKHRRKFEHPTHTPLVVFLGVRNVRTSLNDYRESIIMWFIRHKGGGIGGTRGC